MSKVLITGATGFIGSHLIQELASKGHEVYGVSMQSTSRHMAALHPFLKDSIVMFGDIADYKGISNIIKSVDPDVVIHLAALSPVRNSFENPFAYVRVNVNGTLNIAYSLLELDNFKKKKLIYASTAEVYGPQKVQPIKEDVVLNPSSPYANTKASTDMYLRMLTNIYGLNTTIMRCTNTYGRKLDPAFFIEYLITSMLKNEKIYIGAPDSVRDYMYVTDHVGAYLAAMEHPQAMGEAFNAGPGIGISNKDVAYKIAGLLHFDKKNILLGKYPPGYPSRPLVSDQPFIVLDNKKIGKALGWKPKVELDEGLEKTVTYWKEKLGK